jgi:hypothetical protein
MRASRTTIESGQMILIKAGIERRPLDPIENHPGITLCVLTD